MTTCLVLSHGRIARAFLEAAKQITGKTDALYAVDCSGFTPQSLHQEIVNLIESKNLKDGLFIFVSLRGGSYWNAAARISKEYEKVQLISGLNLCLVLSFITKKDDYSFEELGNILLRDAVRGITSLK
ncbi:MAG: PTS sugar transporter subunit IIA [bacterium]